MRKALQGSGLRIAPLSAFLLLSACSSASRPIRGTDNDVFFPAARASVDLLRFPGERTILGSLSRVRREEGLEAYDYPRPGVDPIFAAEVDYGFAHGNSSQTIQGGQFVDYRGATFNGPARVSHRYDLHAWSLAALVGVRIDDQVWVESLVGAGMTHLDLELESEGVSESDSDFHAGPLIGAQVRGRILPWLGLFARGTIMFTWGYFGAGEMGVEVEPLPGVGIIGGYRWWEYEIEITTEDDELDLSGPFAGVLLRF